MSMTLEVFFFYSPAGSAWLEEVLCGSEGDDLVSPEGTASLLLLCYHRNAHPPPLSLRWWMLLAALLCVCALVCFRESELERALREEMRLSCSAMCLSPPAGGEAVLPPCKVMRIQAFGYYRYILSQSLYSF